MPCFRTLAKKAVCLGIALSLTFPPSLFAMIKKEDDPNVNQELVHRKPAPLPPEEQGGVRRVVRKAGAKLNQFIQKSEGLLMEDGLTELQAKREAAEPERGLDDQ